MSGDVRNNKNAGFSLVELMVVVGIIAVLLGVVTVTFSIVGRGSAKSYATTLKQAIATSRSETMGRVKDTYELYIIGNADGSVDAQIGAGGQKHQVASSKIPMEICSSGVVIPMTAGRVFTITFSKTDGSVKQMQFVGGAMPAFGGFDEIWFQCGESAGTHYDVHLVIGTGKTYIK